MGKTSYSQDDICDQARRIVLTQPERVEFQRHCMVLIDYLITKNGETITSETNFEVCRKGGFPLSDLLEDTFVTIIRKNDYLLVEKVNDKTLKNPYRYSLTQKGKNARKEKKQYEIALAIEHVKQNLRQIETTNSNQ